MVEEQEKKGEQEREQEEQDRGQEGGQEGLEDAGGGREKGRVIRSAHDTNLFNIQRRSKTQTSKYLATGFI